MSTYDDYVATKSFYENVVKLTKSLTFEVKDYINKTSNGSVEFDLDECMAALDNLRDAAFDAYRTAKYYYEEDVARVKPERRDQI